MSRPSDHAARARAIDPAVSVLVQAPAGSGKTTLLAQRYLRLLSQVDAPERILALTFTRRAAQEMRERVLQALAAARLEECPSGMNPETFGLAVTARRHLDALHFDVERQPSRLRIETIDAFNAWLAAQLPISAGAGSALRILADARPSYEEAARRTLAHQAEDGFGVAVDGVLTLDDQRWVRLVALIAEMLPGRDRWLPLLAGRLQAASLLDGGQLQKVRRHFDEDLELLVLRVLMRAAEALGAGRLEEFSRLVRGAAQRAEPGQPDLVPWLEGGPVLRPEAADLARWRAGTRLLFTADGELRRRLTKKHGFPPQCADKLPMLDFLEALEQNAEAHCALEEIRRLPEPRYSDEQWSRVRDVAQVLVLAAATLDQVFREQGAVDFAAVSLAALRALGRADAPSDLSLRLDYQLQHILVDEFQDTSSAQLELVRLLTSGWQPEDGRSVFCVGDPMQSIYGFRQAEVRAFLELAEEGIGELHFDVQRLRDNFRSAAPLVDWINGSFARILPRSDDRDRGAIAFRPSVSAVVSAPKSSAGATAGDGVQLLGFAARAGEAAAIAEAIEKRLEEHPRWHIAVLVRARTHARGIAAALRARGIQFRAVEIEPLQDRAVVRDIIMLTCALLHLGDRVAWLAVLRAPWVGLCLADLLEISRDAPLIFHALGDAARLERLSDDGRARCRGLHAALEAAFRVRGDTSLVRWVERTWLRLGGASCAPSSQDLDLAGAAFARLDQLEQHGLPDAADLPASFSDLYADHGVPGAVEIMTIHKAKGLEFDMVVLPALDRFTPAGSDQLLLTHQFARTGRDGLVMAARPAVGAERDPLFDFLRRQLRAAAALEAQRLLYVACTRAKWQLMLTACIGSAEDEEGPSEGRRASAPWSPRSGSLLAALWPVAGPLFTPAAAEALMQRQADAPPRGGPLLRVPPGWVPHLDRRLPQAEPPPPLPTLRAETPIFDWAGETARRVGTLVHAELHSLDIARSGEEMIRARASHFRRWLALHGVPADRLAAAVTRTTEALIAVQRDMRGRWILQPAADEVREHAISGRWEGGVARVVIDRMFVDEKGIRWIIDYKTSQHTGGDLEQFLDREVERYRPQLQRYAMLAKGLGTQPIRLGLYFPLMQAWREWAA